MMPNNNSSIIFNPIPIKAHAYFLPERIFCVNALSLIFLSLQLCCVWSAGLYFHACSYFPSVHHPACSEKHGNACSSPTEIQIIQIVDAWFAFGLCHKGFFICRHLRVWQPLDLAGVSKHFHPGCQEKVSPGCEGEANVRLRLVTCSSRCVIVEPPTGVGR